MNGFAEVILKILLGFVTMALLIVIGGLILLLATWANETLFHMETGTFIATFISFVLLSITFYALGDSIVR